MAGVLSHAVALAGTGYPASQGLVAKHPAHGSASSAMMATGSVGSPRRSWRTLPTRAMVPLVAARTGMGRYQAAQGARSRLSSQQADGPAVWSPRPRATSSSPWSGPAPALLGTAAPHRRAPGRGTSSGQGRQGRRSQVRPRSACLSLSCLSCGRTQRPRWPRETESAGWRSGRSTPHPRDSLPGSQVTRSRGGPCLDKEWARVWQQRSGAQGARSIWLSCH